MTEKLSLKQAMLAAATRAGGPEGQQEGLVAYLEKQALTTPGSFLTLLGKLGMQQEADIDRPIVKIELVAPLDRQENNEDG